RIATITGPLDTFAGLERQRGWSETLVAAGLEPAGSEEGDYTPSGGAAAARRLIAANAPFDALFIASAQMASGAGPVLKQTGLGLPGAVAFATMDHTVFSPRTAPQLATVYLRAAEKGAAMMATDVRLIKGEQIGIQTLVPMDLV